jgi:hypothetical protein
MRRVVLVGLFLSVLAFCLGVQAWGRIDPASVAPGAITESAKELRLVRLPDGVGGAVVRGVLSDGTPVEVRALDPMVMRGVRLLPVVVPHDAATGDVRLEFSWDKAAPAEPLNEAARRCSRGFFDALQPLLVGDAASLDAQGKSGEPTTEGTYLIVTAPAYRNAIEPLAQWKREKGLTVRVATTEETGVSRGQIQSWISNLYRNDPRPPQFLLLVGDVADVPAFDSHGVVSDLPYTTLEGNDFLPDLLVGRLSVSNESEAQTVVAKILRHERDPFRGEGPTGADWMGRALTVATDEGSATPVPVCRWIQRTLREDGFARVDSVYWPYYHGIGTTRISELVNAGVSLIMYRGWAYGWDGWSSPRFIRGNVRGLSNGFMLPAVFSFVCDNNKFDEAECFGETWLRAGTPEEPKGAVAFIGNGEPWSHTRFNDGMAIGAMTGIHEDGARRLGDILIDAKMNLLRQFPLEITYASHGEESAEFYFNIYNLLGDPEMELWVGAPRGIAVTHPDTLDLGANQVAVQVLADPGGSPLEGVRVGLSQGSLVLGSAWTDGAGQAHVPVEGLAAGIPVVVTVTGKNCQPYHGGMVAAIRSAHPGLAGTSVREDGSGGTSGNADGKANPGETVALLVGLRNSDIAALAGATATLVPWGADSVETSSVTFPSIGPGATADANAPFLVRLRRNAEDGTRASFTLRVHAGGQESLLDVAMTLAAPTLRYAAHQEGEGFVPGAETNVSVTVRNEGSVSAGAVRAVLHSLNPELLTVVDSTADFGAMAPGAAAAGQTPFRVRASAQAAVGAIANLQLVLTSAEGYENRSGFALSLGAADHTSPLGGSRYGYWAYDNSDTDYPDGAPLYGWTEISQVFGGSGTFISLDSNPSDDNDKNETANVALPFPFRLFGVTYRDSLKISDNGWVSFSLRKDFDYYNWSMPTTYGNGAKLAAFWDNLYPAKKDAGHHIIGDGVYAWADSSGHRFIIEWSRIGNTDQPASPPATPLFFTDLQTFQIVLHDPAFYPTPTGDGMIEFRYKQILNVDKGRMYSTVGIMDAAGSDGIQYTYSNVYPAQAAPLSPGLAIRWTTQPPRYMPFALASFKAEPTAGGVALSWAPVDERPRGAYRVYRAGADGVFRPLGPSPAANGAADAPAILDGSARGFFDATANPAAAWQYQIRSADPVGRETVLGPFAYEPALASLPPAFSLEVTGANPFREMSRLSWSLRVPGEVSLRVHAVDGRVVRTLLRGAQPAGRGSSSWDGCDDAGRAVPAGIYWARLQCGDERRSQRLLLVR